MEVAPSTHGENTNFTNACEAAASSPALALKIEQMVSSDMTFSDADFNGMDANFGQYLNTMTMNDVSGDVGAIINLANIGANWFPPAKAATVPLAYSHMFIQQAIRIRQGLGVDGTGLAVNFSLTTISTLSGVGLGMAGKTGTVLSTVFDVTLTGMNELHNVVSNGPPTRH